MNADTTADREIVVSRVFDAPRELVFAACTEREHVEHWWGTGGVTTLEWNLKPGGTWRYRMPGQGGSEQSFTLQYIEITSPAKLVYDFSADGENAGAPVRTSLTFEDQDGKTKVTLQLMFASAAERDQAAKYGAAGGAKMALNNLADYLARR